jgi:3-phenylpropionate/cinnamic acid dioxygenase small subunit
MSQPTDQQLIDFVVKEAQLLDSQDYNQWLGLFADDGYYWMPLTPGQTDAKLQASLMYEDTLLLKIRVARLAGARTYSQQPMSRCHHLLQQPVVTSRDEANSTYTTRTSFHYIETRLNEQTLYAGWATHTLAMQNHALRIKLKRVDLVNCDAAFGNIQLFM